MERDAAFRALGNAVHVDVARSIAAKLLAQPASSQVSRLLVDEVGAALDFANISDGVPA